MKLSWMIALSFFLFSPLAQALGKPAPHPPLETAGEVDLSRYIGVWYEIARLPQSFEKDCTGVTARYDLRDDGKISVENRCFKNTLDGPLKVARGVARVVDTETRSKLEVSFFRPFWGDYWILELGSDYEYSVVGSPDRKSLWILSRLPQMDETLVSQIIERREAQGFDLSTLERTLQAADESLD